MPQFFGQQEFYTINKTNNNMNLIHVRSTSKQQINEVIDLLLDEKLILDPMVLENVYLRKKTQQGVYENEKQFLMVAKARALHFVKIESILQNKYNEKTPDIYSLPIVNMDWKKADVLQKVELNT